MTTKQRQYRHGDVFIASVEPVEGVELVEGNKLAEGTATGHSHKVVKTGETEPVLCRKDGVLYLNAVDGCAVVHEEHRRIEIPPGFYKVSIQQEYVPGALPRNVMD